MEKCRWMNGEYVKAQSGAEFGRDAVAWLTSPASAVDEQDPRHVASFRVLGQLLAGRPVAVEDETEALRLKSASPLLASLPAGLLDGALGLMKPKVRVVPEIAEHVVMAFDPRSAVSPEARAKAASQPGAGERLNSGWASGGAGALECRAHSGRSGGGGAGTGSEARGPDVSAAGGGDRSGAWGGSGAAAGIAGEG